jgi:hypothetical protein
MISSIVSRHIIVEIYEAVYHDHKDDSERFKAVQEKTGAGLGCIAKTMSDYHEEGKE